MSLDPMQATSTHSTMSHMFYNVLCPTQSLTKRVTIVVGGGLLLIGGLYTAYSIISKYFVTSSSPKLPSYPEIPEVGKQAILATIDRLKDNPNIKPHRFEAGYCGDRTHQPVNAQIAHLTPLYFADFKALEEALKRHQNNPWEQEEVLQAADALMKTAYTIGCLTLQDLHPFTERLKGGFIERLKGGGKERTYADALRIQDSYPYQAFFCCTRAYHWIRGGLVWDDKKQRLDHPTVYIDSKPIFVTETYAQRFYEEGTKQHSWNQLYNDYCDRVRSYVKEEDLWIADERHVKWTRKDTGIETFFHTPDTLPT